MRPGFRSFHLKSARPVRRRGSRLGTGKANEIGSRLGAGKANEIGFQARTPGPRRAKIRPQRGAAASRAVKSLLPKTKK